MESPYLENGLYIETGPVVPVGRCRAAFNGVVLDRVITRVRMYVSILSFRVSKAMSNFPRYDNMAGSPAK